MIKPKKISIGRTRNDRSVVRRDIHITTAPRLKRINKMMTRARITPVVD